MPRTRKPPPTAIPSPFTVLIDSREKAPFAFAGLLADARDHHLPILVRSRYQYIPTGDYSIEGHESAIAVERKSLEDLYSTLGQHRERFEAELERLAVMTFAAVVVEADWRTILSEPPSHSRLLPKTVFRSVLAWQQRYTNVHWMCMGGRRLAEVCCYRILERYWRDLERIAVVDFQDCLEAQRKRITENE